MERLAPSARAVCGMSLGGATTTRLAAIRPDLVRRAAIIDVTPQVNDPAPDRGMTAEQRGSVALIAGPPTFDSYEQMVELTRSMSPTRTEAGIRRGVRHNSFRGVDGRWAWRYDLQGGARDDKGASDIEAQGSWVDFTPLWDDVSKITVPTMLVLGADSVYVRPPDVEEFRKRLPSVRVETVPGAGHAIQSDQPAALVKLLEDFAFTPT